MGFGDNSGHHQPVNGLAEQFAAKAGVRLTPRDHARPFNPQTYYERYPPSDSPSGRDYFLGQGRSGGPA
jgi:hypothetical protein